MWRKAYLLVLLACGLLLACSGQESGGGAIPYQKQPLPGLMVGGQPSQRQLETLNRQGYTTVVNLRREGEFDGFDERRVVEGLGMRYVHIPVRNIAAITPADAQALHAAIDGAAGPVLLHCTVGWRAGGLLAIEGYLLHDASAEEALQLAAAAHMDHATGDVEEWISRHPD